MAKIAVNQFAILSDEYNGKELRINSEIKASISESQHRIGTTLNLDFMTNEERIITLSVTCEFRIHDDDWARLTKTGNLVVEESDMEFFVVQTIGTARGILYCKTEGTKYNWIILPSINVHQMKIGNFEVKLQNNNKDQ